MVVCPTNSVTLKAKPIDSFSRSACISDADSRLAGGWVVDFDEVRSRETRFIGAIFLNH
jgi:hypothetical protein